MRESPDEFHVFKKRLSPSDPGATGFGVGHGVIALAHGRDGTHIKIIFTLIKMLNLTPKDVGLSDDEDMWERSSHLYGVYRESKTVPGVVFIGDISKLRGKLIKAVKSSNFYRKIIDETMENTPDAMPRSFWELSGRCWDVGRQFAVSTWQSDPEFVKSRISDLKNVLDNCNSVFPFEGKFELEVLKPTQRFFYDGAQFTPTLAESLLLRVTRALSED